MYSHLSNIIANILLKNNSIEKDYVEVYAFGIEKMVSNFFGMLFLLIATWILKAPTEMVIFYFGFKHLRIYSGGYHARTYTTCNIIYILVFAFAVLFSRIMESQSLAIWLLIFSIVSTILLSPIENPNNPIQEGKYYVYYIYSILTVSILAITLIMLIFFTIDLYKILSITMFLATIFMWIEIIQRRINFMKTFKKKVCDLVAKKASKNAINTTREVSYNRMHQPKTPTNLSKFINK